MKMVAHETPGMDLPGRLGASLAQRCEKQFAVLIIVKDIFMPIATIHHVIDCAFILHAQLASHARTLIDNQPSVNTWDRPLLPSILFTPRSFYLLAQGIAAHSEEGLLLIWGTMTQPFRMTDLFIIRGWMAATPARTAA